MKLNIFIAHFCIALLITPATAGLAQAETAYRIPGNKIDNKGWRQGYWRITGEHTSAPGYKKSQLVEEGEYEDNKRTGLWKKYYKTGELRSEINYENNLPRGSYKIYYSNGQIQETGEWQSNKNTGAFTRYHENGQVAQSFNFNRNGKREGTQRYYYANGNLQMQVEVADGVAHGMYTTYFPNGDVKEEKRLVNGEVEPGTVKVYKPKSTQAAPKEMPVLPTSETTPDKTDKPNLQVFKESGFNTLYNRNQQITQVGEFKNGRLWNGKWHRYDENGILKKVEVYKEGRYIGNGIIEEVSW